MLQRFDPRTVDVEMLERIQGWTRTRFKLAPLAPVLVSEVACSVPGCPPLQTVVAFWTGEARHQFRLFKPLLDVLYDDIGWLMATDHGTASWDCC